MTGIVAVWTGCPVVVWIGAGVVVPADEVVSSVLTSDVVVLAVVDC